MSGFSLQIADAAYYLTLAFGSALSLWFFLKQYLDCRVGNTAALLIYTLFLLFVALLYSHASVFVHGLSVPLGTFLLALVLYRDSLLRKLLVVAVCHVCILFLDLPVVATMKILEIPYAAWTQNRLFVWIANVIVANLFLIPIALLLRPVLRAKEDSGPQSEADLTRVFAALFAAVTIMVGFVLLSASAEKTRTLAALCAADVLLVSAVLLLFWLFKRIDAVSRQERKEKILVQEYQLALERQTQAEQYQQEIRTLEEKMTALLDRLSRLIAVGRTGDAVSELEQSISEVQKVRRPEIQRNLLVDYLLAGLEKRCALSGIRLRTEIDLSSNIGIDDVDFCTILSNLMDNAVNAASEANEGKRFLDLNIHRNGNILFIGCENSKSGDGICAESPSRRFGHFGLVNIRETASKYDGDVQIEDNPDTFIVQTLIYCKKGTC